MWGLLEASWRGLLWCYFNGFVLLVAIGPIGFASFSVRMEPVWLIFAGGPSDFGSGLMWMEPI